MLIVELAEVKYGVTLFNGQKRYTFDISGEEYVCKYSKRFLGELIEKINNEEIITINSLDFEIQYIMDINGNYKKLFYSKNLKN